MFYAKFFDVLDYLCRQNLKFMRLFMILLSALALFTSCASTRDASSSSRGAGLHPDDVFTVTEADIARETLQINRALKGQWTYSGPSVDVSGKNILAGIGKPIAKGKLKKKLKNAYKTLRLDKVKPQFSFDEDGTCTINLLGANLRGTYNYNPSQEKVTFKWHGIPLTARLKRDGKKKLHLTFDADKLLKLFSLASKVSDSSALKALSFLMDNYDDVMVGFELKK